VCDITQGLNIIGIVEAIGQTIITSTFTFKNEGKMGYKDADIHS
jgi:hypothetical protein